MTRVNKTFKDQKDRKEVNQSYRANREHRKPPRGGMVNLVRKAEEEQLEEFEAGLLELQETMAMPPSKPWPKGAPLAELLDYLQANYKFVGLTPFCLAHITGHSPEEVLAEAEREWKEEEKEIELDLCSRIQLPVLHYARGITSGNLDREFTSWYENELEEVAGGLEEGRDGPPLCLSALMERYGGPTWRDHAGLNFNPFHTTQKSFPPEAEERVACVWKSIEDGTWKQDE